MSRRRQPLLLAVAAVAVLAVVGAAALLVNGRRNDAGPGSPPPSGGPIATPPVPTKVPDPGTASPRPDASAVVVALPALAASGPGAAPPGAVLACAGVGLEAILHGDPADSDVTWLTSLMPGAGRQRIVWPAGYLARFAPSLEVLDPTGTVVAREGAFVDGGCVAGDDRLEMQIERPSFALDCGPLAVDTCRGGNATYQVREALRARMPGRDTLLVRFTSPAGDWAATFADGGTALGRIDLGR